MSMKYVPTFFLLGVYFHISFQLLLEIRLTPDFGGDGTRLGITAYNDTGSTALTIFHTDLGYLGDLGNYVGWCEDVDIVVADGRKEKLHIPAVFMLRSAFHGTVKATRNVIERAHQNLLRLGLLLIQEACLRIRNSASAL